MRHINGRYSYVKNFLHRSGFLREYYDAINNTGHYNFVIVDREIIFVTHNKRNIPSYLELSLEALGLYVVIKAHAIDKNYSWPSIKTLEKITGKKKDSLYKYLKELESKDLIYIEKMPNPKKCGGYINVYVLPQVEKEAIKETTIARSE